MENANQFALAASTASIAEEWLVDDAEIVWRSLRQTIRGGSLGEEAQAAHVLDLLPAMPKPVGGTPGTDGRYGSGLNKAGFREMAVQAIRLAHGEEGLFSNFVETMIETNASGFEVRLSRNRKDNAGIPTDRPGPDQGAIFRTFNRMLNADPVTGSSMPPRNRGVLSYQHKFIWQWWVTGLVVTFLVWDDVNVAELNSKRYRMPVEMTILDPLRIDLEDFPLKGLVYYEYDGKAKKNLLKEVDEVGLSNHPYFKLFAPSINRVTEPRRRWEPTQQEAYDMLRTKSRVPLPPGHFKIERRVFNDSEVYPVPFAVRLYPAVNDKRYLRNMDRSVIRKIVMMILRISIKAQDKGRPRALQLEKTIAAMEAQLSADPEYLQIVALPEGADLAWVVPDMRGLMDMDKYRTVNFEILAAMVGLVASQILDGGGTVDLSLIGEQLWRKNNLCVHRFQEQIHEVYDQIILTNRLQGVRPGDVSAVFKQFSIYATDAFKTFVGNLVARGLLPVKTAVDHIGEDFNSVVEDLIQQAELMNQYGIFQAPATNTQTVTWKPGMEPGAPDGELPPTKVDKQPPGQGRPPGKTETKPRKPRDNENTDSNPSPSRQ